jgi:hypothetical protein
MNWQGALGIGELALCKHDGTSTMNDVALADQGAHATQPKEAHLDIERGSELIRLEHGCDRRSECIVQHGGEETTLDIAEQTCGGQPTCSFRDRTMLIVGAALAAPEYDVAVRIAALERADVRREHFDFGSRRRRCRACARQENTRSPD